jgi:hypothetical protein
MIGFNLSDKLHTISGIYPTSTHISGTKNCLDYVYSKDTFQVLKYI